jgi:hypothetical protein
MARETPMGQVFRNLIDNARSFSAAGGEVRVTLARDQGPVIVTVDDDGPGIPPENLETVFERFYTSRPKGKAFGGNSGLGLSIARQIVEAHGGVMRAENRQDAAGRVIGARFRVDLPEACHHHGHHHEAGANDPACRHDRLPPGRRVGGALIEGPSGVGKSDLALRALDHGFAWWRTTTRWCSPRTASCTAAPRTPWPA